MPEKKAVKLKQNEATFIIQLGICHRETQKKKNLQDSEKKKGVNEPKGAGDSTLTDRQKQKTKRLTTVAGKNIRDLHSKLEDK